MTHDGNPCFLRTVVYKSKKNFDLGVKHTHWRFKKLKLSLRIFTTTLRLFCVDNTRLSNTGDVNTKGKFGIGYSGLEIFLGGKFVRLGVRVYEVGV